MLVANLRQVIGQLRKQHVINEANISSLIHHQQTASFINSLNFSNLAEIFKKVIDYLLNPCNNILRELLFFFAKNVSAHKCIHL